MKKVLLILLFLLLLLIILIGILKIKQKYFTFRLEKHKGVHLITNKEDKIIIARFGKDEKSIFYVESIDDSIQSYYIKNYDYLTKNTKLIYKPTLKMNSNSIKDNFHISFENLFLIDHKLLLFDRIYSNRLDEPIKKSYVSNVNGRFEFIEINTTNAYSDGTIQSTKNRKFFLDDSSNYFEIVEYPNHVKKIDYPDEIINKRHYDPTLCFGQSIHEVIFSFSEKDKKRWLYFFNYNNRKITKKIELPYECLDANEFSESLLSPDGRYLLLVYIAYGVWILDLENLKLMEIDIGSYHDVYIHDWSWDSKKVLLYLDNLYIVELDTLLKFKKNEYTVKEYK